MSKIKIKLNGEEFEFNSGSTVNDLVEFKQAKGMFVVEKNLEILQKENYNVQLEDNDIVEIVGFFGGG